ncbi:MAG: molybdopterin molybdotransferase MoeA [Acidobacteria bacterium]|nr:molybdopterin molybdotransferase MoeA [Acidobacteriota bacterium]MBI3422988.1 molybdopterin molybdotransferase MoeA [Acidobacteriota bacterium]
MLRIEDALQLMLDHTPVLPDETVALSDIVGRVLRQPAFSDLDLPPFDRARMDGYAVRSADTQKPPVRLQAIGEAAAGFTFGGEVAAGQAVRIMTGAPIPAGADAVQKIEVIQVNDDGFIELTELVAAGQFITPRASEARKGEVVVNAGERITPATAAVLASFGYADVIVSHRPRLALLSTGSELVEVHETPQGAQIRNSNTYSLAGYATQAGAEVIHAAIVCDDFEVTRTAIADALAQADVVMLSGGVSMGDYDLVKPALLALGAEILVEKVAMHPGKPTVFAKLEDKVIFGLPGNPVSVAVSFHVFARPVLLRMQGAHEIHLPRWRAHVTRTIKGAPPRRSHQPARLLIRDGCAEAEPLKWGGSSDLVAFMQADALIVVPEDRASLSAGELAEVIQLPK